MRFRYEILKAYFDAIADPLEFYQYTKSTFLMNILPIREIDLVLTETKVKDQVYYKKKIKNKIRISGSDYTYFYSQLDSCEKYWCNIYKRCEDGETFIFRAFFNQLNIEYDLDKCVADIELQSSTIYDCVEKNKNNKPETLTDITQLNDELMNFGTFEYHVGDTRNFYINDLYYWVIRSMTSMKCTGYENDERMMTVFPVSDFFNWQKTGLAFGGGNFLTRSVIHDITSGTNAFTPIPNYVNIGEDPYYIAISFKSNILDTSASNPQLFLEITFADIEKLLREVFNVYWVLEPEFYMRFEHYSWFNQNMNYDTTSATNFPLNKLKNKFRIEKEDYPSEEVFQSSDNSGLDFVGTPIKYPVCANGQSKIRGYEKLSTDIDYITNNSAITNIDGIVLFDIFWDGVSVWYPVTEVGKITTVAGKNRRLSWANLHYDLHRHNRPFKQGTMNGVLNETFLSPVYKKEQDEMIARMCCEDEFKKEESLVRTEMGDGIITESEANFSKEIIKFKLKHD